MKSLFEAHPASVGETYLEHMRSAFSFGGPMLGASFACFAHGLFPFLFTSTGSRTIRRLHDRMVVHRDGSRSKDAQPTTGLTAAG